MLSTFATSSIERRRAMHRRQNSTPTAYEAQPVRPLPTNIRQQQHQRSGMSLDLHGLRLETTAMSQHGPYHVESFSQEDSTVSNTNIGQPQQQFMQVAQPHSHAQPGPREPYMVSPVQPSQQSLPSPRTPRRILRGPSPPQAPPSPSKSPSKQQLIELHEHIKSVYGSSGQVFINILPTPTTTPQKPLQSPSHEPLDSAPMPHYSDMADINLEPTSSAMTFDLDHPDADVGYESSSYYTSDALSPSPHSSPRQKSPRPFLDDIEELAGQESIMKMEVSQQLTLLPSPGISSMGNSLPLSNDDLNQQELFLDDDIDASLEYTGISTEEVQRYISEQDPTTNKWTCLYPECCKVFGRRENIRSHVQTHLGDRQFRCNGCGKCFVRQHDLKRHAKIHTGNKPYKCPCGGGFARQDALTRHRQRGMCVGGFPDAVRRQAKRGRPKKVRPDMEERTTKSNRTRRALASASCSVSAGSPSYDIYSTGTSPQLHEYDSSGLPHMMPTLDNFLISTTNPFSFESISSTMNSNEDVKPNSFASSSSFGSSDGSFDGDQKEYSQYQPTHTPPMSPSDQYRPHSSNSTKTAEPQLQQRSQKGSFTPSRQSLQSNQFSTPPTSPAELKTELDELFDSFTETAFDLEMKAMGDFSVTALDNSSAYEFLNFPDFPA